jgi:4-aminobutyrate aminotransferase-like enzyme
VVKVMPALTIDADDLARGITILEEAADAVLAA